ncbi:hypothetical protein SAMN04489761_3688 [Tenacibaculum sp. MAR_2009_124]|uniref:hypothetical protein n=1 Tax=Tenacibaculum sp. MAR_2009_124 TaxID=1250059 RepID=UPI00089BBD55|nr:hypothetical protein [Tenacibaculum sp. MAR_2009_124]SEC82426.1 hypothetical protein SAMN04489761_3688 [Tenacibaculum sp. MAR_2009_124]
MSDIVKNKVETNVNFDIDPIQLIKDIFGSDKDRNNLAVAIENGTNKEWKVEWNNDVGHGDFHDSKGNSKLKAINPYTSKAVKSEDFELGFKAVGAGCNVAIKIKLNDKSDSYFGIMAATPVNKTNYVKAKYYEKNMSFEKLWDDLDDMDKHYGSEGALNVKNKTKTVNAEITIEETSPAACIIKLEMV